MQPLLLTIPLMATTFLSIFPMELTNLSQDQCAEILYKRDSYINTPDADGKTLLIKAIKEGNAKNAKILLENRANPWIKDNDGKCAFHAIIETPHLTIARLLLKRHGKDTDSRKSLFTIGSGHIAGEKSVAGQSGIECLFLHYEISYENSYPKDPLFKALLFGNLKKIDKILTKKPTRINQAIPVNQDASPTLPLTWAILLEDEELATYLLKKRADIFKKETGDLSPYDWAEMHPTMLPVLRPYGGKRLERQERQDILFESIRQGEMEKVKLYLDKDPQLLLLPSRFSGAHTPLEFAKMLDQHNIAKYIISRLSETQRSALRAKNIQVLQALIKEGKEEFSSPWDRFMSQELSTATQNTQQFINTGAETATINLYDEKGLTPLLWACINGDAQDIAELIKQGANLNKTDEASERTGLRWLLRMHKNSVKKNGRQITTRELLPCFFLLICAGAELGIPDIYGETIVDRIEVQNFTTEERDLVNEVLQAKKLTKNGRKQLLEDIFLFQKKDAIQNKLSTQHLVKQNGIFRDIYTEYIQ